MQINSQQVLSAARARVLFDELHEQVATCCDRVVIQAEDSAARCVLISEAELLGMERALEILSGTTGAAQMRAEVMRIASELMQHGRVAAAALS